MKTSFYLLLCVVFLDYIGVGLIFPVFSSLLFSPSSTFLPQDISADARGLWLGILIAMMPLAQFFSSPLWGTLSDDRGRKKPLIFSLICILIGYLVAASATWLSSLLGLALSRLIIGFASGNVAIVQASIADLSSSGEKAKNYSLYGMSMGAGFTLGPVLGGWLATQGYALPFLVAAVLVALNLVFVFFLFRETNQFRVKKKIYVMMGLIQLKKALRLHGLRTVLLCSFLGTFGWVYFFEFVSVYLIGKFHFSPGDLGLFFGIAGGCYALSTGLLIRPLIKRFKAEPLFFTSALATGLAIVGMVFVPSAAWIWPMIILICYVTSPFSPTSTTVVSNSVSAEIQGEVLGVLGSVNAAAFALAPLCSGTLIGAYPTIPMWVGGLLLCSAGVIGLIVFRRKISLI